MNRGPGIGTLLLALALGSAPASGAGPPAARDSGTRVRLEPVPEPGDRRILFAEIPWNTPDSTALVLLSSRGYTEVKGSREKLSIHCRGKRFDRFCTVDGGLDDSSRVIRWQLTVQAPNGDDVYAGQRKIFDDMVAEMKSKYGPRRRAEERYHFPYARDDGREELALRQGYATIRSEWKSRTGDRVTVEMDHSVSVVVRYDSKESDRIDAQRRRVRTRDL